MLCAWPPQYPHRPRRGFDAVLLDLTVRVGMGGVEAARLKEWGPA
jgi:hypothetical protein